MKASVDSELCTGCGLCAETCPEVFEMTDDGFAVVIVESVEPEFEGACVEAADECPPEAISIID